jgi:hypothetical protein
VGESSEVEGGDFTATDRTEERRPKGFIGRVGPQPAEDFGKGDSGGEEGASVKGVFRPTPELSVGGEGGV